MRALGLTLIIAALCSTSVAQEVPTPADYVSACKVLAFLADQALDATPQRQGDVFALHNSYADVRRRLQDQGACSRETEYFRQIRLLNLNRFGGAVIVRGGPVVPVPWTHREMEELSLRIEEGLPFSAIEEIVFNPPEAQPGLDLEVGDIPELTLTDEERLRNLERMGEMIESMQREVRARILEGNAPAEDGGSQ